ncbi:MAG: hypothetical protein MR332_13075 [Fusicatenibacter sp.]|nr:hypothetical protein [Fusicatenibacter sp.]
MYSSKHFFRYFSSLFLALSVTAVLLISCVPVVFAADTTYKTCTVTRTSIAIQKESKASLLYPSQTVVRYEGAEATYVSSPVKHGQTVQAGEVLMTVTPKTDPIDCEEKELELARLKKSLEDEIQIRNNHLAVLSGRKNTISDSFEYRKLQLDIQKCELELAHFISVQNREIAQKETELEKIYAAINAVEIKAPVSGIVTDLIIPGDSDTITSGMIICRIEDPSFCMAKSASCLFPFGSHVQICGDRMGEEVKIAAVVTGSSSIESIDTDKFSSCLLPQNEVIHLETISNLSVIGTTVELEQVLLIPTKAVHTDNAGSFVYVLTEEERSKKQYITAYCIDSDWTWSVCGLDEGQTLILR